MVILICGGCITCSPEATKPVTLILSWIGPLTLSTLWNRLNGHWRVEVGTGI